MNKKIVILVPILLVATAGLAVWLSGLNVTGNVISAGNKPSVQLETWNIDTANPDSLSKNVTYVNNDGLHTVSMVDGSINTENINILKVNS